MHEPRKLRVLERAPHRARILSRGRHAPLRAGQGRRDLEFLLSVAGLVLAVEDLVLRVLVQVGLQVGAARRGVAGDLALRRGVPQHHALVRRLGLALGLRHRLLLRVVRVHSLAHAAAARVVAAFRLRMRR